MSIFAFLAAVAANVAPPADAPRQWVDSKTGHRVVVVSDAPGASSPYFNISAFTPQGDRMVISTAAEISSVDLKTWKVKPLVTGQGLQLLFTGHRSRDVYYILRSGPDGRGPGTVWAANIDTGKSRRIADVPRGGIQTINADETLLAGVVEERPMNLQPGAGVRDPRFDQVNYAAVGPDGKTLTFAESKEVRLNDRLDAHIPMELFTINTRTGERRVIHRSTEWLNHLLFSPADPNLLMFCHEGPWHKVDRIWTILADGTGLTKIHTRTMNMEIAGHEFWAPDGKTIWYDLQTPRGEDFWVAGYDIGTARRRWYHLTRNEWSVHFNISPDGRLFSGDGGDKEMVAHAPDGKWLYLFHPRGIPDVAGLHAPNAGSLIEPGVFDSDRILDMSKHDYRLEPNIHFTPDGKWFVFRSNMEGHNGVYAVELAKSGAAQ